jgi:starch synthase
MRVLHVASELFPLVKTGGLGDVAAALPSALRALGIDARLVLPGLPAILAGLEHQRMIARLGPAFGAKAVIVRYGRVPKSGVPAYAIDAPELYDRPGNPYLGPDGRDWPDNHRRFALLSQVAARFADGAIDPSFRPDIAHGHDWHAGLMPAYLAARGGFRPASVMTIHNLAFQGLFAAATFAELHLPESFFAPEGVEFWGRVSFLKAGLFFADRLTTVSPTYAREIQTATDGFGLDVLLRARAGSLVGILNGVDRQAWDPAHDPMLARPYDADDIAAKATAKLALQSELGLAIEPRAPLIGMVSRLTAQKGIDLAVGALPHLFERGGQVALLGSGESAIEEALRDLAARFKGRLALILGYDEDLAHRIVGGADMMLVPSRFEPCGLTQLHALRYGAVPIVRRVGGLADTVVDADAANLADGSATGIVFDEASIAALTAALDRALALHGDEAAWSRLMRRGMTSDFGWEASAAVYARLYRELRPGAAA